MSLPSAAHGHPAKPKSYNLRVDYPTGTLIDVTPTRPAKEQEDVDREERAIRMMVPDMRLRKKRVMEMKRLRLGAFIGGHYDVEMTEYQKQYEDTTGEKAEKLWRAKGADQHGAPRHPWRKNTFYYPTRADARRCRHVTPAETKLRRGRDLLKSIATLKQQHAMSWAKYWTEEKAYDYEIADIISPVERTGGRKMDELEISAYKKAELERIGAVGAGQLVPAL